ncbi:MAG TPA: hypothetical protein PKN70_00850 [Smithellaceae bacterium]|nr:hypothetical protein [Smithellaceae bacterium]HQM45978.1 hypothetical protein [Smithellaceae bacterium]
METKKSLNMKSSGKIHHFSISNADWSFMADSGIFIDIDGRLYYVGIR